MKDKSGWFKPAVCASALLGIAASLLVGGCSKSPRSLTPLPAASGAAWSAEMPASRFDGKAKGRLPLAAGAAEEVWILARGEGMAAPTDDTPGTGTLMAKIEERQVPMPLKHTRVRANVSGYIGSVDVTQQFENPYSGKIEAVYVFPLPHNAAIHEFIMTIGERRIRGIIRERKEAEQLYQEAKRQGYVASLLTQERPNVFTQSVANIEPGKQIEVNIKYFNTLEYVDGWYEFVFPLVVGPRFNPPGSTSGIGAVARGNTGASSQSTEVHYLKPGERTGHEVNLELEVDAGVAIEEVQCRTHQVTTETASPERLKTSLSPTDRLPNRDFVFRFRVAGDQIKSSLVTQRDARGGFFTLMLYPPQQLTGLERQPLELVFVVDCSGSMSGAPLQHAKAAVERALRLLQRGDSFQLINFSVSASQLGKTPLEATDSNVQRGLDYLRSLHSEGGTMMIEGIKAALDFPHDPGRLRFVCFLTDGYIGNEVEILGAVHDKVGPSRIFGFGIGSAVNRYLLDRMAWLGKGAVAYLGPKDDAACIMEDFFARIAHPAITDLRIDWGGMHVTETFPRVLPDLFVGRPVVLAGRFAGESDTTIRVNGLAAGERVQVRIPAKLTGSGATHTGLPSVWARMKIADLEDQATWHPDPELPQAIKTVALDYNLMSPFTAFVAVDSTRVTEGDTGTTVPVAVPVPEGVRYDTTVQEK
jgi:Ca-activated chloride channel homolog